MSTLEEQLVQLLSGYPLLKLAILSGLQATGADGANVLNKPWPIRHLIHLRQPQPI